MPLSTFANKLFPLGGGGGGDKNYADRAILERTIGIVVLDRMNGINIGSVTELYKRLGGSDPTVAKVLTKAFGDDFDRHADKGIEHVIEQAKKGLAESLKAEGLAIPTTSGFRDMLFHLPDNMTFGEFRRNSAS